LAALVQHTAELIQFLLGLFLGLAVVLGRNLYDSQRYDEAIGAFRRVPSMKYWHHAYLAACYAFLGENVKAAAECAECLKLNPDFRVSEYCANLFYPDLSRCAQVREGMMRAGLPDE
jgi:adenylate cyclase